MVSTIDENDKFFALVTLLQDGFFENFLNLQSNLSNKDDVIVNLVLAERHIKHQAMQKDFGQKTLPNAPPLAPLYGRFRAIQKPDSGCMAYDSYFFIKPFVPNAPFLHHLKTSENRKVLEKGCIGNKLIRTFNLTKPENRIKKYVT